MVILANLAAVAGRSPDAGSGKPADPARAQDTAKSKDAASKVTVLDPAAPPLKPAAEAIEVAIGLAKTAFTIGEPFTFTLRANRDCNLLVFTIDAADKVELHDPNLESAYMGAALLKAGEVRQIPIPGAPGRAVIKAPVGGYQLGAVCAREDLTRLGLAEAQLRVPAANGKRSFTFTLDEAIQRVRRDDVSRVTVGYQVK